MADIDDILANLLSGESNKQSKTPQKVESIVVNILQRLITGGLGAFCLILITIICAFVIRRELVKYRTYTTTMEIMLQNEKDSGKNGNVSSQIIGGITGWNTVTNKFDEIKIMSSRSVVLRMLRETHILDSAYVQQALSLGHPLSHADSVSLVDEKVNEFRKAVGISYEETTSKGSSSIIKLTIHGYQGKSKLILNGMVHAYNGHSKEFSDQCYAHTLNFLGYCIDSVRNEINKLDLYEENFSEENFIVNLNLQSSVYLDIDKNNETEVRELQLQQQLIRIIRDYMVDMGQDYKIVPANTGINDDQINKVVLQFNELVMRRSNYMTSMGEDAMRVQTINNQIEDQRQAIIVSISKLSEALDIRLAKFEQNLQESNDRLMTMPRKQLIMSYLAREREIIAPLYSQLQKKRTETLIAQAGEQDQCRVVSSPYVSESLLFAKGKSFYLMSVALALGLAFLFLWKIKLPEPNLQLENILSKSSLPVWGVIPQAPREVFEDDEWRRPGRKGSDRANNFDAALRSLLTHIEMSGAKTIVITSGYRKDGKTFLTHQLANLLIDKGISFEVLDWRSESNLREIINERREPSSSEDAVSYTLIDAGSYHENPELPILSREADTTLYCLRAEYSDLDSLDFSNYAVEQNLIFKGAMVVVQADINQRYAVNYGSFDYEVPSGLGVVFSMIKNNNRKKNT